MSRSPMIIHARPSRIAPVGLCGLLALERDVVFSNARHVRAEG